MQELQTCLALDPEFPYARYRYALALEAAGRTDEALVQFRRLRATRGAEMHGLVGLARGLMSSGRPEEARACADELLALSKQRYVSAYFLAEMFAGLGDTEAAFGWLDKAYDERAMVMMAMRRNPRFDPLRADPRFAVLEQRVGFWD